MKAFLDNFAAILDSVTVLLLLMSVSHEYGYFWYIGRHYQTLLTTSDYFSNAVLWLPTGLVLLYAYLDWDVMLGRARYAPLGLNWEGVIFFLFFVIFPIVAFFYIPPTTPYIFLASLVVLWLRYGTRLLPFDGTDTELLQQIRRALIVVPVVMAVVFGYGLGHGQSDLKSFDESYTLQLKDGEKVQRVLLRTFDKGILVRDVVEDRIEFVRWDDIAKMYRFAPPPRNVSISCSWLGVNCPDLPPNP
jgi:hypothetical protein